MSAKNFFNTLKSMVKTYRAQKCSELAIEFKYMDDGFKWFWQINLFGRRCCARCSHLSKVNKWPEPSFCTLQWISKIQVGVVNRIEFRAVNRFENNAHSLFFIAEFWKWKNEKKINNIITIHRIYHTNGETRLQILQWLNEIVRQNIGHIFDNDSPHSALIIDNNNSGYVLLVDALRISQRKYLSIRMVCSVIFLSFACQHAESDKWNWESKWERRGSVCAKNVDDSGNKFMYKYDW